MPVTAFHGNGMVSQLEILRGDLADVLYQATANRVEYRFDTRITDLGQSADSVEATLSDGTVLRADLVVGADGPHSAVRRLAFGPEEQFVLPLGGYNAWFTAPDTAGLDGWYLMYQAVGAGQRPHRFDLHPVIVIRQCPQILVRVTHPTCAEHVHDDGTHHRIWRCQMCPNGFRAGQNFDQLPQTVGPTGLQR